MIPAGKKKCIDNSDAYNANFYVFMQVFFISAFIWYLILLNKFYLAKYKKINIVIKVMCVEKKNKPAEGLGFVWKRAEKNLKYI